MGWEIPIAIAFYLYSRNSSARKSGESTPDQKSPKNEKQTPRDPGIGTAKLPTDLRVDVDQAVRDAVTSARRIDEINEKTSTEVDKSGKKSGGKKAVAAAETIAQANPYGAAFVQVTRIFGDMVTNPRISGMADPWGEILYGLPPDLAMSVWSRALRLPGVPMPAPAEKIVRLEDGRPRIKLDSGYTAKGTQIGESVYDSIKLEEAIWTEVHRRKLPVPVPWQDEATGKLWEMNLRTSLESFVAAALGVGE